MKILILTDIHEDYGAAHNAGFLEKPDLVLDCGDHKKIINLFELIPHYFIAGNHEPTEIVLDEQGYPLPQEISPGRIYTLKSKDTSLRFSGIGGNYSSFPGDKHVVKGFVESLQRISKNGLDILLFHESPFNIPLNGGGYELAQRIIREVKRIQPPYVFSGHSNIFKEEVVKTDSEPINVINLQDIGHGYAVLEKQGNSFDFKRIISRYR